MLAAAPAAARGALQELSADRWLPGHWLEWDKLLQWIGSVEESIRVMSARSLQGGGALKLLLWTGRAALQLSTLRLHIHAAQHRAISLRGLALRRTVLGKTELPTSGEAWQVAPMLGGVELAFDGLWCRAELDAFEERPSEQQEELCRALGMSVDELHPRAPSNVAVSSGAQGASAVHAAKSIVAVVAGAHDAASMQALLHQLGSAATAPLAVHLLQKQAGKGPGGCMPGVDHKVLACILVKSALPCKSALLLEHMAAAANTGAVNKLLGGDKPMSTKTLRRRTQALMGNDLPWSKLATDVADPSHPQVARVRALAQARGFDLVAAAVAILGGLQELDVAPPRVHIEKGDPAPAQSGTRAPSPFFPCKYTQRHIHESLLFHFPTVPAKRPRITDEPMLAELDDGESLKHASTSETRFNSLLALGLAVRPVEMNGDSMFASLADQMWG